MKVELNAHEMGLLIGLISEYKRTHPYNIQENRTLSDIGVKMIQSVHDSINETKLRSNKE